VNPSIDRIQISVRDMAASVALFRDVLEMTVVGEGPVDGAGFQRLWGLPAGTAATAVYLRNDEQSTAIELLEVTPHSGRCIREGAKLFDHGLFDIAFRTKHLDVAYEELTAKGYTFQSAPIVYTADWANVTVREVIMNGPDQMPIALIERLSAPLPVIEGRFGTMVDVAQFVPAMDACQRFYADVLGYTSVFDRTLPDGLIDGVVGLPPGTRSRLNLMFQTGTKTPAVEMIECAGLGRALAAGVGPTRYGLFAMAMETADLLELLGRIGAAGFAVLSGPTEIQHALHGRMTAAAVRGPNQELIEFFSRL